MKSRAVVAASSTIGLANPKVAVATGLTEILWPTKNTHQIFFFGVD